MNKAQRWAKGQAPLLPFSQAAGIGDCLARNEKKTPNPKMHFPKSHAADLSVCKTPVPKGTVPINGQNPRGDCVSVSLIQFNIGFTTRCNWIHAGESKAKKDQGPNLQQAPAGFSGATTAFISILSDPNKRSELFSKGREFFDSILLQTNCPSKGKGTGSEGGGGGGDAEGRCCCCLALC